MYLLSSRVHETLLLLERIVSYNPIIFCRAALNSVGATPDCVDRCVWALGRTTVFHIYIEGSRNLSPSAAGSCRTGQRLELPLYFTYLRQTSQLCLPSISKKVCELYLSKADKTVVFTFISKKVSGLYSMYLTQTSQYSVYPL